VSSMNALFATRLAAVVRHLWTAIVADDDGLESDLLSSAFATAPARISTRPLPALTRRDA
jgi:hypothetical protein